MTKTTPTPYAVICPRHGKVFLSHQEYDEQMRHGDSRWACPCGLEASFDDAHWESFGL